MSAVRMISQGATKDHEAFSEVVKRACVFVEEHEPGTVAYECFADEVSGRVLWDELFADADAFVTHIHNLSETGTLEELLGVYEIEQITVLTPIVDGRVKEIAEQFGAVELHRLGSVVR